MPFTPPSEDDLQALQDASAALDQAASDLQDESGRIDLVISRLSQPVPPPPPPEPALPAVGVVGASVWNAMPAAARQSALAVLRAAGITHFRFGVPWPSCERKKGVYDFRLYVTLAKEIVAAGLIPLAVVAYTPTFYRRPGGDQFSAPTSAGVLAFGVFCRALFAALTAVGVFRFEIWNEANHAGPPGMNPVEPTTYVDLLAEAHVAACDVSRHIRLVAGAFSPAPDKLPTALGATAFVRAMLAYEPDVFSFVDEVSEHPYAGTKPLLQGSYYTTHHANVRAAVPAHIPISATEFGWATSGPTATKNTEARQAELIVDAIRTWPEAGPLYIFNYQDWGTGADRDNSQGLVRLDGSERPALAAVRELLT